MVLPPRDFKSLASTCFATWAIWRLRPESNRRTRLCRPLHDHSATQPLKLNGDDEAAIRHCGLRHPRETGAGNESRTRDLNLGKVALYQLSYSRVSSGKIIGYGPPPGQLGACRKAKPDRLLAPLPRLRQRHLEVVRHRHQREQRGDIDQPGPYLLRAERADAVVIEQQGDRQHL